MSAAGIIIGVLAFLAFLALIGYSIYSITSDTICNSSGCISPGGNWLKDKCTCSCNPGYSGVNCQTKSKHVSDLETACKDKTGKDCSSCLKTNISQKLKGNPSDVQQFTDDFTSSISAINDICCSKNCSNTSGTACDKCVSENMNQLGHIKDDTSYFINDGGCLSFKTTNQAQNFIGKTNICITQNADPCFPNPCKNGGECVLDGDSHKCKCNLTGPFFDGPTCSRSCRKEYHTGDCDDIEVENNCDWYYSNKNEKCEKKTIFGKCSNTWGSSGGVGSEKCNL